jgi:hypothetical protein
MLWAWRSCLSLAAFLVSAFGIGTATALFSMVRSVLLEPLPFEDPARLIPLYCTNRALTTSFHTTWLRAEHNLSGVFGQLPEKVRTAESSRCLFPTLGAEPALGPIKRADETSDFHLPSWPPTATQSAQPVGHQWLQPWLADSKPATMLRI